MIDVLFKIVEILVFGKLFLVDHLFAFKLSFLANAAALTPASPVFVIESLTSPAEVLLAFGTNQMVAAHVLLDSVAALWVRTRFHEVHDV